MHRTLFHLTDDYILEFALFLVECQNGTECIQAGSILEYSENIKRLLSKLPFHLHDRWRNVVFRIKDSHSKAFLINAYAITSVSP
jgi:uncharacterized membrane protein